MQITKRRIAVFQSRTKRRLEYDKEGFVSPYFCAYNITMCKKKYGKVEITDTKPCDAPS